MTAGRTTAAGLGWSHQKRRAAALRALCDGDACRLCGRPMFHGQDLDLDHVAPRVLGGHDGPTELTHATCNRAAGGRLAGARRRARRSVQGTPTKPRPSRALAEDLVQQPRTSRVW